MSLGISALGLITVLELIPAGRAIAQFSLMVNTDGVFPSAGLVLSGNTMYGTAQAGGSLGHGAVFAVHTDGTGFESLHSFNGSDGMNPYAALTGSSNALYGTANCGGGTGAGTVFEVNANGTGLTTLYNFAQLTGSPPTNSDGADPYARLILSGSTLYGTAEEGGSAGSGAVFAVNSDGTQFRNLHSFTVISSNGTSATNSDGFGPQAGLVLSGNTLYGTASYGGNWDNGTVFALNTDGTGFTNLHSFAASSTNSLGIYTNGDGANPTAEMILSGSTLYGTTQNGGSSGNGTVFAINTDGTGFRVLHSFTDLVNHTNSDGANPHAGLVLSDKTLYGAGEYGGNSGNGMIFAVNTDGTGFTNLYSFTILYSPGARVRGTNTDGTYPYGTLVLSSNTLYGTALFGGDSGNGTVFALKTDGTGFTTLHSFSNLGMLVPQLTITLFGTNIVLTWPADTGSVFYSLESTTDSVTSWWNPVSFTSAIVDGQNVVNLAAAGQQFFRLRALVGGCQFNGDCPLGSICVQGVCMVVTGGGGGFGSCNGICCCNGP